MEAQHPVSLRTRAKSQQKSSIKTPGDLEWHVQVAFVFTVSIRPHVQLCIPILLALNAPWSGTGLRILSRLLGFSQVSACRGGTTQAPIRSQFGKHLDQGE